MAFSRHFSLLAGAMATVAIVAPAFAQDAKAVFEPRYAELHKASEARDFAAAAKLMTPAYEMVDIRGDSHTMSEMQDMMGQMPQDPNMKPKYEIVSATISGTTATVQNKMEMHMSRPMEDGTTAELDVTVISEDSWVQQGGVWLLNKTVQKDLSVSKDGEVVFHQAV
ncbi:nuclear transport factor 2 family protein [Novosphingobium sp.]|uniref:nuclear transport factor 2 family protein n=1 Tax=Novosphingobium sp. TaxID=1874826 RepID=UPI00286B111B|nr:nuclear transport factor 2 family protein [Novosphingobium sp.]